MPKIEVIALFDFKKGNILRQGTLKCLKDVLIFVVLHNLYHKICMHHQILKASPSF